MSEEFTKEQQKLYQYAGNSNLVLPSDRSGLARRGERGKEIESLWGRINPKEMGSRATQQDKPTKEKPKKTLEEIEQEERRALERKRNKREQRLLKSASYGYSNILAATEDMESLSYRPRTRETRRIWDLILAQTRKYLADQSEDILLSAADETLALLKDDGVKDLEKKRRTEKLFGVKIPEADFSRFVQLAKQIVDYSNESENDEDDEDNGGLGVPNSLDDTSGVAVVFDGSDDDDDDEGDSNGRGNKDQPSEFVIDGDSSNNDDSDEEGDNDGAENDDEQAEENRAGDGTEEGDNEAGGYRTVIHGYNEKNATRLNQRNAKRATTAVRSETTRFGNSDNETDSHETEDNEAMSKTDKTKLRSRDIDAFWLQRQFRKIYSDLREAKEKTDKASALLTDVDGVTQSELENELAELLEYSHLDFVQVLVHNREMVTWSMRLARAESEGDHDKVRQFEDEMRARGLAWIIDARNDNAVQADNDVEMAEAGSAPSEQKGPGGAEQESGRRTAEEHKSEAAGFNPRRNIVLDDLAFSQGGHLMTNEKWVPPKGSEKLVMPGYEEIRVPAPERPPPAGDDEPAVSIASLPAWSQKAFSGTTELNRVQSRVFPAAFESDDNLLICAPTGAGKTNCAALTMLRAIGEYRDSASGTIDTSAFKMVYIAPMKALVSEVAGSFTKRLEPLGIRVAELTGDSQLTKRQITETQLIVTTPEKWDVVTRKGGEGSYTALVRLVIIDEIHLLHDDRGPVLEALVCRLLRTQEQTQQRVRLVGLSATLPNYEDVATFLRVPRERGLFHFDARFRPCPLQQEFVGITEKKHIRRLERMDEVCYTKAKRHAAQSQVLVFVHSRKETVRTAQRLRDMAVDEAATGVFVRAGSATSEILRDEAEATQDQALKDLLPFGFGCHHAGMTRADRRLIEDLFADGRIKVLVSTATLAWGVNLPAHAVIIKGTQVYSPEKGRWSELSPQDVLQMLGRAGRPQFDTFGEGVIITAHSELRYYLSLLNQQLPIESQLVSRLADLLNAEIVLGTIRSRDDAVEWLGYTYLFVRMLRNPVLYGVDVADLDTDPSLVGYRAELIHAAAVELERSYMVRYERKSGRLQATELGRVASHYYITHRSMAVYQQDLRATATDIDMLRVFSQSDEFRLIPVRAEERVELQRLIERVPVPMREASDTTAAKINVLLQAYVARLALSGFALVSDMVYVTQSAGRIFRALFELCVRRGWAMAAHRALGWCKQVERRMWLTMSPLRQFGKACPSELLRAVERKPFPWDRYVDLNAQELGELVGSAKAGRLMHRLVHLVPRLEVSAHVQPLTRTLIRFELRLTPDFEWDEAVHGVAEQFWIWVEDADGERILHSELFVLKKMYVGQEHVTEFTCALTEPVPPHYFVNITSDRWIGSATRLAVSFKHLKLPDKSMPPTELVDMQPLGIGDLHNAEFEEAYRAPGSPLGVDGMFNAVQTQVFHTLYRTDDSTLVAASPGSGKTLIAEIALLRFFKLEAERARAERDAYVRRRAVCILPFAALVRGRAREWRKRFAGVQGGKNVVVLSGDTSADLKRIENAHIIVSAPGPWDALSRRWRQRARASVREIGLFIADELHWVGGTGLGSSADDIVSSSVTDDDDAGTDTTGDQLAATYEVIVSRIRYMGAQLNRPIRIVGLSVPLANARDVAAWIGSPQSAVFNFQPAVRPVPLEIHIQTSTVPHFASRMISLAGPTYRAICASPMGTKARGSRDMEVDGVVEVPEAERKPAIVFVPSRRQCRLTASELLVHAAADGIERRFLRAELDSVSAVIDRVSDKALAGFLRYGVGYYHEALCARDMKAVLGLFEAGAIQVLVASRETCWALDAVRAHTVVVMGAERYNGREHRYTDYSIPEVLQMMGRASRAGVDKQGVCVLMCMANKKELYKKFLYEALPIESRLDVQLHDPLNSEIVARTIENKQDAVDYLTWTLMYRRLVQNPNYYGLQGTTNNDLSDYLSELIETTINDLVSAKCVAVDADEVDVSATNFGMIAAHYQIRYLTVEMFALSVSQKTKLRGVLDILTAADEFEPMPVRHREDRVLSRIAQRVPVPLPQSTGGMWGSARVRAHLLLQAHFSRIALPGDLAADQVWVLGRALPLLQAMVDIASSMGWIAPALAAMELSQMTVQAVWDGRDPLVKQIPHLASSARLAECSRMGVESVFDVMDMEDAARAKLLDGLTGREVGEVARFVNRYPNIEVEFEVVDGDEVAAGDSVTVNVGLDREWDGDDDQEVPGPVIAPFFPYSKDEGWWIVIGDVGSGALVAVKRVSVGRSLHTKVQFVAPEAVGPAKLKMFLMCDGYLGCDQEFDLEFNVVEAEDEDEDEDESSEEE